MTEKDCSLMFKNNMCTIFYQNKVEIMFVRMKNKSYYVDCIKIDMHAYSVLSDESVLGISDLGTLTMHS